MTGHRNAHTLTPASVRTSTVATLLIGANVALACSVALAEPPTGSTAGAGKREKLRTELRSLLGIPDTRCPLEPESRGRLQRDDVVIEKWIWTSEPGSRVPSVLYRPAKPTGRMPAIVVTCGHGGSKSQPFFTLMGQLYAKLGVACLVLDPVGEEERNARGRMGTRAHDPEPVHRRADEAGRLIMGKLVFDTMRGIDFLLTRDDIDPDRIGVAGNSLGGAKAGWMLALDTRIKLAIVSGWGFDDLLLEYGKFCTRVPNRRLRTLCSWSEFLSLAAPHCAVIVMNGDADIIIDRDGDGKAWRGTRAAVGGAAKTFEALGGPGKIDCWFEPGGGHRPYQCYKVALEWIHRYLGTPGWTLERIRALPTINSGDWCKANGVVDEKLYGTKLHRYGATLPDLNIRVIRREDLACLKPDEVGDRQYTLKGWLYTLDQP